MLYANSGRAPRQLVQAGSTALDDGAGVIWIDLVEPTEAERATVERVTKLRLPAKADVAEIESSSRLAHDAGTLYLSTPMTYRNRDGESRMSPLGLILSHDRLITLRFAEMPVFDSFAERFATTDQADSIGAFSGLLETIVDRLADVLEHVGADLEVISGQIFAPEQDNLAQNDARLRATLREIGRAGTRLANLRDSLVGLQRIMTYVGESGGWIGKDMWHRCGTLSKDVVSLMDYDVQLANKMQFLLDATLGFINIEQNNGIKVLTVVSVVGVPPTLIASIYGMNFKLIPELQWDYGYFYALVLIVLSAILPLVWFKKRGWI